MEKNNMQIYNIDAFSKHVESCLAACISGLIHCDLKVVVIRPFTPFFKREMGAYHLIKLGNTVDEA